MKQVWKFPALVRGKPPRVAEERLCLVSGEVEVDVRVADIEDMPIALSAEYHYNENGEFRFFDGALYRSDDDEDTMEIERDSADLMSAGRNAVYQKIADEIIDIMKSGTVETWPKEFKGRISPVKALSEGGVKLSVEGEADLDRWRERIKERLRDFVIAGGRTWVKTGEPVYLAHVLPRRAMLLVDTADVFGDQRDELGKVSAKLDGNSGSYFRIFSLSETEAAIRYVTEAAAERDVEPEILDEIDVLVPEAIGVDVGRLEFDRIARVAAAHAGERLTRVKPAGGEYILDIAPRSLLNSWKTLKEFLRGYNPLHGVPDSLEEMFADFVAEADGFAAIYGPCLIDDSTRDAIGYAFERWEDRRIDLEAAPVTKVAG